MDTELIQEPVEAPAVEPQQEPMGPTQEPVEPQEVPQVDVVEPPQEPVEEPPQVDVVEPPQEPVEQPVVEPPQEPVEVPVVVPVEVVQEPVVELVEPVGVPQVEPTQEPPVPHSLEVSQGLEVTQGLVVGAAKRDNREIIHHLNTHFSCINNFSALKKIQMCRSFIIKMILSEFCLEETQVIFSDHVLKHIISVVGYEYHINKLCNAIRATVSELVSKKEQMPVKLALSQVLTR
jgi:hypothetical protein